MVQTTISIHLKIYLATGVEKLNGKLVLKLQKPIFKQTKVMPYIYKVIVLLCLANTSNTIWQYSYFSEC